MPGIIQEHKIKDGVRRCGNHSHYAIVPSRVWYSDKQGTAESDGLGWYREYRRVSSVVPRMVPVND